MIKKFSIFFVITIFFFIKKICYTQSIQEQIDLNKVTINKNVITSDNKWKFSIKESHDGEFLLTINYNNKIEVIDSSSKPDFRICWSKNKKYIVIVRPLGFVTMVKLYSINDENSGVNEIFASEKVNQRNFVDYSLQSWDLKNGRVIFNVYENPRYLGGRIPRLLSTEYIYLDGKNGY